MSVNSYLHTALSPYQLNSAAMELIKSLNESFSKELEEKILILINSASLHPKMSKYQLSLTHKALGDCYYNNEYFQSALEQYNRAVSNNPKISVKRRINKILNMPIEKRITSLSPDIIADVTQFPEYKEILESENRKTQSELDSLWSDDTKKRELHSEIRKQLINEAQLENSVYDAEHEAEIERRLNKLGEPYISEFYRIREERSLTYNPNDTLSLKDLDLLDLADMERSASFNGWVSFTLRK